MSEYQVYEVLINARLLTRCVKSTAKIVDLTLRVRK